MQSRVPAGLPTTVPPCRSMFVRVVELPVISTDQRITRKLVVVVAAHKGDAPRARVGVSPTARENNVTANGTLEIPLACGKPLGGSSSGPWSAPGSVKVRNFFFFFSPPPPDRLLSPKRQGTSGQAAIQSVRIPGRGQRTKTTPSAPTTRPVLQVGPLG